MASNSGNEKGNSRSPDTVVCESLTVIKNEKKASDSLLKSAEILQRSKETVKGYKICCLTKAEESHEIYQDLMSCVTIENYKKTKLIQTSVEEYIKKKDDEIETLISDSSKLLNDLRIKMEEANNAACAMANCVKNKLIPKSSDKNGKNKQTNPLEDPLNKILEKTKMLDEKGQNAFKSMVTIAGIQTFTNTASLTEFVTKLMEAMTIFKDCVATNIQSTGGEITKAREELNTVMEELAQIICDKYVQTATGKGLHYVKCFVCETECDEGCIDLCKDFEICTEASTSRTDKGNSSQTATQSEDSN